MSTEDGRTPAPQETACTTPWHEALKTDDGRWRATTWRNREHVDETGVYEFAECVRCCSTLVRTLQTFTMPHFCSELGELCPSRPCPVCGAGTETP